MKIPNQGYFTKRFSHVYGVICVLVHFSTQQVWVRYFLNLKLSIAKTDINLAFLLKRLKVSNTMFYA